MAVKFVHVLKRIESLERDIREIHALQSGINNERGYSTPIKISLEQQVNNLLNEKTKLMEVRIDNPPEFFTVAKKKEQTLVADQRYNFDKYEEQYFIRLQNRRTAGYESAEMVKSLTAQEKPARQEKASGLPSLAEKSLLTKEKPGEEKSPAKRRADLLKDLPPLEY